MDLIPVLDISRGVAVHARAGDRPSYAPVRSVLAPDAGGDPVALLRGFREGLGAAQCYVADLDAIQGGAVQHALLRTLAASSAGTLLVDAGAHEPARARALLASGAELVVVGLESLRAFEELVRIVAATGPARLVFSLDLRLGRPMLHPALQDAVGSTPDTIGLARQAVDAGIDTLLVLDVGRVGTGCGVDVALLEALRRRFPEQRLLGGGGVLTGRDLERMRDAGCDGALVASAIHAGRIGRADLAEGGCLSRRPATPDKPRTARSSPRPRTPAG